MIPADDPAPAVRRKIAPDRHNRLPDRIFIQLFHPGQQTVDHIARCGEKHERNDVNDRIKCIAADNRTYRGPVQSDHNQQESRAVVHGMEQNDRKDRIGLDVDETQDQAI